MTLNLYVPRRKCGRPVGWRKAQPKYPIKQMEVGYEAVWFTDDPLQLRDRLHSYVNRYRRMGYIARTFRVRTSVRADGLVVRRVA